MPLVTSNYKNSDTIEPLYDGVVMLSPDVVFFSDAQPRPDGRKIYHIFEHSNAPHIKTEEDEALSEVDNFHQRKSELFSKASTNTINHIQNILEENGISFDEWCPPLSTTCDSDCPVKTVPDLSQQKQRKKSEQSSNEDNYEESSQDDGMSHAKMKSKVSLRTPLPVVAEPYKMKKIHLNHQNVHQGKKDKYPTKRQKFYCTSCNFYTFYKANLKTHNFIHLRAESLKSNLYPNENRVLHCAQCSYTSKYKSTLNYHLLSHINECLFNCSECGFQTKYKNNLKKHEYRIHKMNKSELDYCDRPNKDTPHKEEILSNASSSTSENNPLYSKRTESTKMRDSSQETLVGTHVVSASQSNLTKESSSRVKIEPLNDNGSPLCSLEGNSYEANKNNSKVDDLIKRNFNQDKLRFNQNNLGEMNSLPLAPDIPSDKKNALLSDAKVRMYKCSLCNFKTKYKASVKNHEIRIHGLTHTIHERRKKSKKKLPRLRFRLEKDFSSIKSTRLLRARKTDNIGITMKDSPSESIPSKEAKGLTDVSLTKIEEVSTQKKTYVPVKASLDITMANSQLKDLKTEINLPNKMENCHSANIPSLTKSASHSENLANVSEGKKFTTAVVKNNLPYALLEKNDECNFLTENKDGSMKHDLSVNKDSQIAGKIQTYREVHTGEDPINKQQQDGDQIQISSHSESPETKSNQEVKDLTDKMLCKYPPKKNEPPTNEMPPSTNCDSPAQHVQKSRDLKEMRHSLDSLIKKDPLIDKHCQVNESKIAKEVSQDSSEDEDCQIIEDLTSKDPLMGEDPFKEIDRELFGEQHPLITERLYIKNNPTKREVIGKDPLKQAKRYTLKSPIPERDPLMIENSSTSKSHRVKKDPNIETDPLMIDDSSRKSIVKKGRNIETDPLTIDNSSASKPHLVKKDSNIETDPLMIDDSSRKSIVKKGRNIETDPLMIENSSTSKAHIVKKDPNIETDPLMIDDSSRKSIVKKGRNIETDPLTIDNSSASKPRLVKKDSNIETDPLMIYDSRKPILKKGHNIEKDPLMIENSSTSKSHIVKKDPNIDIDCLKIDNSSRKPILKKAPNMEKDLELIDSSKRKCVVKNDPNLKKDLLMIDSSKRKIPVVEKDLNIKMDQLRMEDSLPEDPVGKKDLTIESDTLKIKYSLRKKPGVKKDTNIEKDPLMREDSSLRKKKTAVKKEANIVKDSLVIDSSIKKYRTIEQDPLKINDSLLSNKLGINDTNIERDEVIDSSLKKISVVEKDFHIERDPLMMEDSLTRKDPTIESNTLKIKDSSLSKNLGKDDTNIERDELMIDSSLRKTCVVEKDFHIERDPLMMEDSLTRKDLTIERDTLKIKYSLRKPPVVKIDPNIEKNPLMMENSSIRKDEVKQDPTIKSDPLKIKDSISKSPVVQINPLIIKDSQKRRETYIKDFSVAKDPLVAKDKEIKISTREKPLIINDPVKRHMKRKLHKKDHLVNEIPLIIDDPKGRKDSLVGTEPIVNKDPIIIEKLDHKIISHLKGNLYEKRKLSKRKEHETEAFQIRKVSLKKRLIWKRNVDIKLASHRKIGPLLKESAVRKRGSIGKGSKMRVLAMKKHFNPLKSSVCIEGPLIEKDVFIKKDTIVEKYPFIGKDPFSQNDLVEKDPLMAKDVPKENDTNMKNCHLKCKISHSKKECVVQKRPLSQSDLESFMDLEIGRSPLKLDKSQVECDFVVENSSATKLNSIDVPSIENDTLPLELVPRSHMNPIVLVKRLKLNSLEFAKCYQSKNQNNSGPGKYVEQKLRKCVYYKMVDFKEEKSNQENRIKTQSKHLCENSFKCPRCDFVSGAKKMLKQHMYSHSTVKMYKCSQCSYSSGIIASLRQHAYTHIFKKTFYCSFCSYATKCKSNLRMHESIHPKIYMYKCHLCSFYTNFSNHFKLHCVDHLDISKLNCFFCNFQSDKRRLLKKHLLHHREKCLHKLSIHECSKCISFSSSHNASEHHKLIRVAFQIHKCSFCNYETSYQEVFRKHMQNHDKNNALGSNSSD